MNTSTKGSRASRDGRSSTLDPAIHRSVDSWLSSLGQAGTGRLAALLAPPFEEQLSAGYGHTLREICQQPLTWVETVGSLLPGRAGELRARVEGAASVVVTGSGSSLFAGECVAPCLQQALRIPVSAVPAGLILTHPGLSLPPSGPYLVVSLARSGNSPESGGVVDWLLENQPQARHLIITCNRDGSLATSYGNRPGLLSIVLDDKTDDKSLVMTSSFTNLVLAARSIAAAGGTGERAHATARSLARAAGAILHERADAVCDLAAEEWPSVVFLGSGCRLGSAHEAGLKMLEMTGGDVGTMAESYLGLRHGPMSAVRKDTLVVAFVSSDPVVRAYETDLLRELSRKGLGERRLVVGTGLPDEVRASPRDVVVDTRPVDDLGDEDLTVIDVLVGQLLAFFRCRRAGYRPDSPSEEGVITRVVSEFVIHRRISGS